MNKRLIISGVAACIALMLLLSGLYVVDERQQALVLQFGKVVRVVQEPGLKLKVPFIQTVQYFDHRILNLDPPEQKVILADNTRLDVDTYARYKIVDPLKFKESTAGARGAFTVRQINIKLSDFIKSSLPRVLGNVTLDEMLSDKRELIMDQIQKQVDASASRFGIKVVDVRIRRADYPEEASQKVFERMRREREREAEQLRAEGDQESSKIRATADREETVILAEARMQSQIVKGEGDAEASKIYAESFGRDPKFYEFYRKLDVYKNTLANSETTLILSSDDEILNYLSDFKTPQ